MNKDLILVAENGDESIISWSQVLDFQIDGYDTTVVKLPCDELAEFPGFYHAFIEIAKAADKEHLAFGCFPTGTTEFGWIAYCDLAQIIVEDSAGAYTYHLREDQRAKVSVIGGNLVIEIH